MIKKHLLLFGLALLAPALLHSKSMSSPESRMVRGIAESIRKYRMYIEDVPIVSWDQIAQRDLNLYAANSYLEDQDISELYSFVPLEDRSKFPDGDLILIRYEAIPYPEMLKDEYHPDDPRKERNESFYKPVRYLVYRDKKGELIGTQWYEEDIQKMLAETGIKIPPPVKFTNYIVSEKKADEAGFAKEAEPAREKTAEVDPAVEQSEEPVEQSSNWWLWLIGAVTAAIVITVLRKKNPSANEFSE